MRNILPDVYYWIVHVNKDFHKIVMSTTLFMSTVHITLL